MGRPKGSINKKVPVTRAKKSRRLVATPKLSKTGIELTSCYCRKCMQNKKPTEFFDATDVFLDANGKMSVCRDCISEIYVRVYQSEHSMERTLLRLCRMLNMRYDEGVISRFKNELEGKEVDVKTSKNVFGLYKARLTVNTKRSSNSKLFDSAGDLTFTEPGLNLENIPIDEDSMPPVDMKEYFEAVWGKGLTNDDYEYLEQEFAEWQRTTKCDTQSELILVKELCFKQNEIRKKRLGGDNVDALVKSLQEIMKNSALTPAQANAASSGKSAECFGMWIKDIENLRPAEWHEKQDLFKDIDNIDDYAEKYIKRPLKNFVTGSRDFNVDEIDGISDSDFEFEEEA
jgi:hypothetical protein